MREGGRGGGRNERCIPSEYWSDRSELLLLLVDKRPLSWSVTSLIRQVKLYDPRSPLLSHLPFALSLFIIMDTRV